MESAKIDLKKTVHLPKTDFSMKANLGQLEPRLLAQWEESGLYNAIREARLGSRHISCTTALRTPTATSTWATRSTNC